ncbi:hypothetical protein VP1G_03770 [Cytospora mali]|uniref:AB hydrolase-1 domain-containing protein n=1 Tax=Cytospora mali TaxID=578113 RepID=A0A194UXN5_CYTMA|nr:hypothetical protein VP1G_03770 [Valsa mali var. pyri (nom. inval.)]
MAGLFPNNDSVDYEMLRLISAARYQGSDVLEILQLIPTMTPGGFESWHDAFYGLAQRVEVEIHDRTTRLSSLCGRGRLPGFDRALGVLGNATRHTLNSPKDDFEIPIIVYKAPGIGPKHTMILGNGFDGVGFIYDWERVVTPVVDFAVANAETLEVDTAKLVLLGYSMGGFLAVRAAAFEHRLAACIAVDGIWDMSMLFTAKMPPEAPTLWRSGTPENRVRFDEAISALLASGKLAIGAQWPMNHAMWAFCTRSAPELYGRIAKFTLEGVIGGVRCPVFIGDAETDIFFKGQPQMVKEKLCEKGHLYTFTKESGADCSVGAAT